MTEDEWHECLDPAAMLETPLGNATFRKLRLFAVACCRQNLDSIEVPHERDALAMFEHLADGVIAEHQRAQAQSKWSDFLFDGNDEWELDAKCSFFLPLYILNHDLDLSDVKDCSWRMATRAAYSEGGFEGLDREMFSEQVEYLRDIFGNPFRPVAFDPRWRTSTAVGIADAMYQSRDFGKMPILGDALLDAGCRDEQVLEHCRSKGPHVRGCWVVGLVLGKE